MRSLIALCAGALVLSGCGATAASGQVHFAGNLGDIAVARVGQARVVADPVAPPSRGTRLAKSEPAKEPVTEAPAAAPGTRAAALGGDASGSIGSMWNDSLEDAFSGGLVLSGVGEGGGGLGGGIGFDGVGTLGDGSDKGAPEIVAHAQMDLGREEGVVRAPRALLETPRANAGSQGSVAARFAMDRTGSLVAGSGDGADRSAGAVSNVAARDVMVATHAPRNDAADGTPWKPAYGHRVSRLVGALGLRSLSEGDL